MAFGADRSVKVVLKAEVSDFVGKMTSASKASSQFGKDAVSHAAKNKQSFDMIGKGLLVGGAAIGAGLGLAVSKFADFDAAMSAAAAASGATGASLGALRDLAIKAGADTQYSATEAAQGITEMAKAGVSAKDIMGGGLTGALSLAAAGQLEVGRASEIAATALNQFNLKGSDLPHVADLFSAAAGKAQGSVEDVANAMKYVGPVANSLNISIEETTGIIGELASQGIVGEQAGTSLRGMLLSLSAPSAIASKEMKSLGLNMYDANGAFIGGQAAIGQLHDKLAPLDEATRNAALGQIFGNEQITAAQILYKGGAGAVADWTAKVNEAGFAQKQANALTNNLKGDIERLGGSIDTALIQGGSAANDVLRSLTQGLTGAVNGIGSMGEAGTQAAVGLAAATSGVALLGGGALVMLPKIAATKLALVELGVTAGRTGTALKIAGGAFAVFAVAAGAVAIGSFASQAQIATVSTDGLAASLSNLNGSAKNTELTKLFEGFNGKWGKDIDTTSQALEAFGISAYNALDQGWDARARRMTDFGTSQADFAKRTQQLDQALAQMVQSGNADGAVAAMKQLTDAAAAQGVPVSEVTGQFTLYGQAVAASQTSADAAAGSFDATGSAAGGAVGPTEAFADAQKDAAAATDEANKQLDDYVQSLQDAGLIVLSTRAAQRAVADAYGDVTEALKKNGKSMDQSKQKGRDNAAVLDDVAKRHLTLADSIYKQTGSEDKMRASLATSRRALSDTGVRLGLTRKEADKYAAQILKIPTGHATKITTPGATDSQGQVSALKTRIAELKNKAVTVQAKGAAGSAAEVAALQRQIDVLSGKTVFVTTVTRKVVGTDSGDVIGHGPIRKATGGYIAGPGSGTSDSIPAWLSNGEYVINAKSTKKFLPLLHAMNASKFATGGPVGFASGGEVDFSGIMAIIQAGAFSLDDLRTARAKPGQARADVKKAQDALTKLLASQAKNQRDLHAAQQKLTTLLHTKGASRTSITSARNRVSDELAEQAKLLGQVASAEGKVTSTRNGVTAATKAATAAAQAYAKANRPLITRTIDAAGKRNGVTAKFLADIRTLMKRGFTSLARNLMSMGSPEAETLAAQAVKSTKDATSLQSKLNTSAKLDADAQRLEDQLNGVNAPVWKGATTTYSSGKKHVPGAVRPRAGMVAATRGSGAAVQIQNMYAVDATAAAQAIETKQRDAIAAFG